MRVPAFSDLDKEQRIVYGNAPSDKNILIVGAPGTGKTIMALHRARKLEKMGNDPKVIMFNKVLAKYTNSGGPIEENSRIKPSTMHRWVSNWWRKSKSFPGLWPPSKKNNKFELDWEAIFSIVKKINNKSELVHINWGHLIVDEGQDFENDMYDVFNFVSRHFKSFGLSSVVTIFADENQQLERERNSTIEDIELSLNIRKNMDPKRTFYLRTNYRNTLQIYNFAKHFQVFPPRNYEEMPPNREGSIPYVYFFGRKEEIFEWMFRKSSNSPGKQIGIIVADFNENVEETKNEMKRRLSDNKYVVQAYASNIKKLSSVEKLDFDNNNTITILNQKSAKGTEFDFVFYLWLSQPKYDATEGLNEKMSLYVMSSRAREELYVLFNGINHENVPNILKVFPRPEKQLCKYEGRGSLRDKTESLLEGIDWKENYING